MKIATWNVNSLKVRLEQVLDWVGTRQPDVLCLQETKLTDDKFPLEPIEESGYRVVVSHDRTRETRKTWDEGVSIIQAPHLYRVARDAGRDAVALLGAIRGMRRAMDRRLIGYGTVVAEKR